MKSVPHPADELAEVRSEIARLRLREGQIRRLLLRSPQEERQGRWFHADITLTTRRQLDPSKLPPWVLENPVHYTEISRTVLHSRAIPLSSLILPGPIFGQDRSLQ